MKNLKDFSEWGNIDEADRDLKYGCVMLYLDPPKWNKITEMIEEDDVYDEEGYGIEKADEIHITVIYGLHTDIPDSKIEECIEKMTLGLYASSPIILENISIFENDDYDVVKFEVKDKKLHKMNSMFRELPNTTDYPEYNPHVTIGYVKKGKGKKYIQKLEDPIKVKPTKVVYSKADGTTTICKKEYLLS